MFLDYCLQVELRNDDAAKSEGEDGIRTEKPEYLHVRVRSYSSCEVHVGIKGKHTEGLRHQGKCWKSRSLSQLSFLAPNPLEPSNWDVSVRSELRSSISRTVGLGLRPSPLRFGPAIL